MQTDILRTINAQGHELNIYGTTEEPLFLAVEVARMIDYSVGRTSEMISRVDEDEKILLNTHGNVEGNGRGNPQKWFLTEDGLYEVLMQSRKPIARRFKRAVKDILKDLRAAYDIVRELEEENLELKVDKAELKEWVDRLLVYTELSEDDMRRKITAEKDAEEFKLQSAMFGDTSAWVTLKG